MSGYLQLGIEVLDCTLGADTLDLSTILPAAEGMDLVVFVVDNRGIGDALLAIGAEVDSALVIRAGETRECGPYQYGAVSDTIPVLRGAIGADLYITTLLWR